MTAALGVATILTAAPAAGAATKPASAPAWSITPTPAAPKGGGLDGVSCTSASACTAVGQVSSGSTSAPLAERWNGTSWAVQATPSPTSFTQLYGVSCASASSCTAVGINAGTSPALAEHWNGKTWAVQATPGGNTELDGVSCTSASSCTAVGLTVNNVGVEFATLAERWNGTAWAVQKTPNPTLGGELDGVSCTSASSCIAVGFYYNNSGNGVPIADRWNGTTWTKQSIPTIAADDVRITGVSCTSASSCIAVGSGAQLAGGAPPVTVAERWNGTTWAMQTTPSPANGGEFNGVSCASASACIATGYRNNSNLTELTLAERWNGTAWAIQKTPNPAGASRSGALLEGVSCTAASSCLAAGAGPGTGGTLAERYGT